MNLLLNPSFGILIFILVQILILLTNIFLMKSLECYKEIGEKPLISVLIPARNEEKNIEKCVNSFINQDYKNFENIVFDDNSNDLTLSILKKIKSERLKIIHCTSIPDNLTGKTGHVIDCQNTQRENISFLQMLTLSIIKNTFICD